MGKTKAIATALFIMAVVFVSLIGTMLAAMSIHDAISPPLPQAHALIEENKGKSYIIFDYEGVHYVVEFRGSNE